MTKNNKRRNRISIVKGLIFTFLVVVVIILSAGCQKEGNGIRPSELVPEEEMIDILTDLYLADGLLNTPEVRNVYSHKDSTSNYHDAIEHHGYTKLLVDKSLEYYLNKKPKKFERIYDRVLENLSIMETSIIQQKDSSSKGIVNLWNGDQTYNLPDKGTTFPIEFDIPIQDTGRYEIRARINVFKDDQTLDPHVIAWYWYDDGTEGGYIDYWEKIPLEKDSRPHIIEASKLLEDPRVTHIRGFLYGHTEQAGHWEKHGQVTNINISRINAIPK